MNCQVYTLTSYLAQCLRSPISIRYNVIFGDTDTASDMNKDFRRVKNILGSFAIQLEITSFIMISLQKLLFFSQNNCDEK